MKKIIRKSGLGEIGENKLRHKIEITLFTKITLCWNHAYMSPQGETEHAQQMHMITEETLHVLSVWKGVTNKNSNILCLVERLTSTTQFSEMQDPKTLPFLNYQVHLIPGGPVISVRNKTQLVSLLDTIHSHCMPWGQKPYSPGNRLVIFSLWKKKKNLKGPFLQTGKKMHSSSTSNWSGPKGWGF